jgi:hypothetical protein
MTYREHRKELLKDKRVREEYEKLLPEYDLARSIIAGSIPAGGIGFPLELQ